MFILKKGHQPGVYVPLRALFSSFMMSDPSVHDKGGGGLEVKT